jgi:hypothetical protein
MSVPRITEILEDSILSSSNKNIQVDIIDKSVKSSVSVTRPANTTAYAISDVVGTDPATNLIFTNFGVAGQSFIILKAKMICKVNAVPSGMSGFKLHLYNSAPTAITDNLAFNLIAGDTSKYLGYIEFSTPIDIGDNLFTQVENLTFTGTLVSTNLYGVLETLGTFTPSSGTVKEISLFGVDA